MKYASAIRMLFLALALGVVGESALFLFAGRMQNSLYRERRIAADAVELWHAFDSSTLRLLLQEEGTDAAQREWTVAADRFGDALDGLLETRVFRNAGDDAETDAALDLWRQIGDRIESVTTFSRRWDRLPAGQIHIILDLNDSFYSFLFRSARQYQDLLGRSGSFFLAVMMGLAIAVMGVSFVLGLRISADIARTNASLERQIRRRVRVREMMQRAKREAEETSRAKSEFLAKVSHELRTPLNSIIGYSELMLVDGGAESEGRSGQGTAVAERSGYPAKILRESEKLLQLVHDLIDLSRIEYRNLRLEKAEFSLHEAVAAWSEAAGEQARRKGLTFSLHIEEDVPDRLTGDPNRVRQVLRNLLSNALKFTEHGRITLSVRCVFEEPDRADLKFLLRDTGIGIPAGSQDRIFDSFTQNDGSFARRYGGFGIGVTIARHLVNLMGGDIGVESEAGEGSLFWFVIPFGLPSPRPAAASPAVSEAGIPDRGTPEGGNGLILLAEDYRPNAEIAVRFLSDAGYRVEHVENGAKALAAAKIRHFDLILMDLQMPDLDGFRTAELIRESADPNRKTPILALTANALVRDETEALARGMNGLIPKPIRRRRFVEQVGGWMRSAGERGAGGTTAKSSVVVTRDGAGSGEPLDLSGLTGELQDEEAARTIAAGFVDRVEEQIPLMQGALEGNDLDTVCREAHAIKGGALNLMAARLGQAAKDLELAARAGNTAVAAGLFDIVCREFGEVRDFLRVSAAERKTGRFPPGRAPDVDPVTGSST